MIECYLLKSGGQENQFELLLYEERIEHLQLYGNHLSYTMQRILRYKFNECTLVVGTAILLICVCVCVGGGTVNRG